MPVNLTTTPNEESQLILTVTLKDSDDATVATSSIASMTWTLTDVDGTVVNSREDVSPTIANPLTIELYGDDLALPTTSSPTRIVTVKATYNSTYGNARPVNEEAVFDVTALTNVP